MELKNLKELKAQWEQIEITWHSVPEIKRDERLQPRKPETDTFRNQSIEERASANQVDGLYAQLMASSKAELELYPMSRTGEARNKELFSVL